MEGGDSSTSVEANVSRPDAKPAHAPKENGSAFPSRQYACFTLTCIVWIVLDIATKALFADMQPGGILAGPFAGLVDIRLVHNTGGAWGIFAGNPSALGVFSLVVCAVLVGYFVFTAKSSPLVTTFGLALIVAGGIGNAIDRFARGYVIDFIEFSFIDFPVFNVADIGVTCGFAILILGMLFSWRKGEGDAS